MRQCSGAVGVPDESDTLEIQAFPVLVHRRDNPAPERSVAVFVTLGIDLVGGVHDRVTTTGDVLQQARVAARIGEAVSVTEDDERCRFEANRPVKRDA